MRSRSALMRSAVTRARRSDATGCWRAMMSMIRASKSCCTVSICSSVLITSSASFRSIFKIESVALPIESETIFARSRRVCETPSNSSWNTDLISAMSAPYGCYVNLQVLKSEQKVNEAKLPEGLPLEFSYVVTQKPK